MKKNRKSKKQERAKRKRNASLFRVSKEEIERGNSLFDPFSSFEAKRYRQRPMRRKKSNEAERVSSEIASLLQNFLNKFLK